MGEKIKIEKGLPRGTPQPKENLTHKLTKEEMSKGGKRSAEVQKQKRTIAEFFKIWADAEVKSQTADDLKNIGITGELNNRALFILPLIKNIKKGDIKSLQLAVELLNEDKEKEAKIAKLNAEIEVLKLEAERLSQENALSSGIDEKIIINFDLKGSKNEEKDD